MAAELCQLPMQPTALMCPLLLCQLLCRLQSHVRVYVPAADMPTAAAVPPATDMPAEELCQLSMRPPL